MEKTKALLRGDHSAWHATHPDAVLELLHTTRDGLSEEEAKALRKRHGPNEFREKDLPTTLERAFVQLKSPIALVLLGAFLVTFALQEFVDAFVIGIALLVALVLGLIQEGRASRAFQKLAHSQVHEATVIREGKKHIINAKELVRGDIVVLESGVQVPADLRIIEHKKLTANEAALTGEWLPVKKDSELVPIGEPLTERSNMLFMGTYVVEGYGVGAVVETGSKTAVGQIAEDVQLVEEVATPLQKETARISRIMLVLIGVVVVFIFILGLFRGEDFEIMLLTAIAIAVASVPEGLPAAVTIILAVAMESLLRRGGLVRNLLSAETLGSTTIILTDKTGTLTEARMAMRSVVTVHSIYMKEQGSWSRRAPLLEPILDNALCPTEAFLEEIGNKKEGFTMRGEPMERAILEEAYERGITPTGESLRGTRSDHLAFSSDYRFAAGVAPYKNKYRLCLNGAPEYLLEEASYVETKKGKRKMSAEDRERFRKMIDVHTERGERVIATAYKEVSGECIDSDAPPEVLPQKNVFLGLLIFRDPVRSDVAQAISAVKKAGVEIKLVTGDNQKTALAVAEAVGIAKKRSRALEGRHIEEMNDAELLEELERTPVFARMLPRQKMRLASLLQKQGEIVAMTGDGVNDAPALRRANIGVSVGSGTEVAKEASDLVLVHDSFEIIRAAIEEGRRVFANLKKIIGYLFATSLSEVALIGTALVIGAPVPLLPAQILWANLIEEGLMSVAFAFEKGEKNLMKEKPLDLKREGILSRDMLAFVGVVVVVMSSLLVALFLYFQYIVQVPLSELRSVMFLAVSIDSLFIAFSFRSLSTPLWKIDFYSNRFFIGAFVLSLALLFLVLLVPFFRFVLSYEPLPLFDILLILAFGFATLLGIELAKWVFFERKKSA